MLNCQLQWQLFKNLILTVNHLHRTIQSAVRMLPETTVILKYVHHLCHLREDQHLHYLTQIHNWLWAINTVKLHQQVGTFDTSMLYCTYRLGTCEASRFDSNRPIPIRNWRLIRNFRISRTCCRTTNHAHCSTKNFNRCAVVIEIYFTFMILCLCSKSIHIC